MCTVLVRAIGLFITQHQIPVQPNSNFQLLYDGLGWCREEMLYTSGTIQETSIVGRRVGHAMPDVLIEQAYSDALQRFRDRTDLGEDVDAIRVLIDHALQPAHLTFDPLEALQVTVLVHGVPVDRGCAFVAHRLEHTRRGYRLMGHREVVLYPLWV